MAHCTSKCQMLLFLLRYGSWCRTFHTCMRGFKACRTNICKFYQKNRKQTEFVLRFTDELISLRYAYLAWIHLWINFFCQEFKETSPQCKSGVSEITTKTTSLSKRRIVDQKKLYCEICRPLNIQVNIMWHVAINKHAHKNKCYGNAAAKNNFYFWSWWCEILFFTLSLNVTEIPYLINNFSISFPWHERYHPLLNTRVGCYVEHFHNFPLHLCSYVCAIIQKRKRFNIMLWDFPWE